MIISPLNPHVDIRGVEQLAWTGRLDTLEVHLALGFPADCLQFVAHTMMVVLFAFLLFDVIAVSRLAIALALADYVCVEHVAVVSRALR